MSQISISLTSVAVLPMMCIRKMSVCMNQGLVPVTVRVLYARHYWNVMSVLMMLIVRVLMAMLHYLVDVLMLMPLRQM